MAAAIALTVLAVAGGALVQPGVAQADTVRGLEYWLDTLHVIQAQTITKGQGVVVAVIDTGVDATHPDLAGQVLAGKGVTSDAAADGRTDDNGHGTGMASIIAGKGGGDNHELGIAPQAKILPVSNGTTVHMEDIAAGIRWAADHGAKVMNISEGVEAPAEPDLVAAVKYALGKDVVVVSATGNVATAGSTTVSEPANIPGVIAVSGIAKTGGFWTGSCYGAETVLAAPSEHVVASAPKIKSSNGYQLGEGTSGGSAIVSGVAALVRAKYPNLNAANVINRLISTAQDLGTPGRDDQFGYGQIDPVKALTASVPDVAANPLLAAGGASAGADSAGPTKKDEPAISIGMTKGGEIGLGVCLAVVVGIIVLVFVLVRRSRRKAPRAPVGGPPPGWVGQPPPGWRGPPTGQFTPPTGQFAPPGPPPPGYRPGPPPGNPAAPPPGPAAPPTGQWQPPRPPQG
jgi:type VII secretion-associated serine protease mycosin